MVKETDRTPFGFDEVLGVLHQVQEKEVDIDRYRPGTWRAVGTGHLPRLGRRPKRRPIRTPGVRPR